MNAPAPGLADSFGRRIEYLRISVTDRCDFRCVYCMAEDTQFVQRDELLTFDEMCTLGAAFVRMGVRKIRLTGGEPLLHKNIVQLAEYLSALSGLEQLVLTTNGSRLSRLAEPLHEAGVQRLNISIDSLQPDRFRELTRRGVLSRVIDGIDAACAAGFERIRLNSVILRGRNDDEINDLVAFAISRGIDIAFIEEMPLGRIEEHDRALSLATSEWVRGVIETRYPLMALGDPTATAGPARMYQVEGLGSRVGFISPHSNNFCHLCNRVRLTAEGRLILCLGNEHSLDLRTLLRSQKAAPAELDRAIRLAMDRKPENHHFDLSDEPQILRFMNATGG
ncbi:MAG: GTP 3',8-cyclase MoaA [Pseudomonadota bacterium]